jgi:hypothetical protein
MCTQVPDLASANASEEDKIAAMMSQAGEEWDPSSYVSYATDYCMHHRIGNK